MVRHGDVRGQQYRRGRSQSLRATFGRLRGRLWYGADRDDAADWRGTDRSEFWAGRRALRFTLAVKTPGKTVAVASFTRRFSGTPLTSKRESDPHDRIPR